jgi:hypothetical protein
MNKAKTRAELINPWLKACSWGIWKILKYYAKFTPKVKKDGSDMLLSKSC